MHKMHQRFTGSKTIKVNYNHLKINSRYQLTEIKSIFMNI